MDKEFKKSSRKTSKTILWITVLLSWVMIFYAIHHAQGGDVVPWAVVLLASVSGGYMGIGHLDYRLVIQAIMARGGGMYGMASGLLTPEPPPEGAEDEDEPVNELGVIR